MTPPPDTKSESGDGAREACRLYLISPLAGGGEDIASALISALSGGHIDCLLLRAATGADPAKLRILCEATQNAETAVVMENAALAGVCGADGQHFDRILPAKTPPAALSIAGAGNLRSRHDAMTAGENGADYVLFGEPGGDGGRPPFAAILERITWWCEIFTVPCVAYAANLEEAAQAAAAGADFVAMGDWVWAHKRGPQEAVREVLAVLHRASQAAPAGFEAHA